MRNNLGLKLVALAVAVLIWMQVSLMADHQSSVKLDLRLRNLAEDDTLLSSLTQIPCLVQGRGLDLIKLRLSKATVLMDAQDLRMGNLKNFELQQLPANLDLTVMGIDPAFSLAALSSSTPPKKPAANPAQVKSGQEMVARQDPAAAGNKTDPADPVNTLVLTNIPLAGPADLRYFPSVATLKVQGKSSLLATLPAGISVTVAESPDARGLYTLKAITPPGVSLLDLTPKQVRRAK